MIIHLDLDAAVWVFRRLRREARRRAREVRIAASRFVRRVREISDAGVLGRMFVLEIPAEFTRMSTFCIAFSSSRSQDPASETSPTRRLILSEESIRVPCSFRSGVWD